MKVFFARKREDRLMRRIERLRQDGGDPMVVKLHKPVLYEEDAYEAMRYWVNLSKGIKFGEEPYERSSNLLKLACGCNEDKNEYWLYFKEGLYYAVQIGMKSKLFIGRTIYIPYCELGFAYIRVPVKDCKWQVKGASELYGYFLYAAEGLQPLALILKGSGIEDKDEGVWGAKVDYTPVPHLLDGYDFLGRKGKGYSEWDTSDGLVYTEEEAKRALYVYDLKYLWEGEKIIHQFRRNERPVFSDFLAMWNIFRKNI